MPEIMTCSHCKEKIKPNPRLKGNQQYCNKTDCQRARKRQWKHEKIESDEGFRHKQIEYVKQWQRERPSHRYMHDYRLNHPDYVAGCCRFI